MENEKWKMTNEFLTDFLNQVRHFPWKCFLTNRIISEISWPDILSLKAGISSSPFVIILVICSSVCLSACPAFREGTLIRLLSTLTRPPSPVSPWHPSQCFLKFARAVANSSTGDAAVAGDAVADGAALLVAGAVSVQAMITKPSAIQAKTVAISFMYLLSRFILECGGLPPLCYSGPPIKSAE